MSIWPPTCLTFVYASMLSLNSVALILMLFARRDGVDLGLVPVVAPGHPV